MNQNIKEQQELLKKMQKTTCPEKKVEIKALIVEL